ncbi:MAG: AMP-binding protein, partial [Clostridia bacterium]|nr:AMP-binding protein [Clostridia bacterium]
GMCYTSATTGNPKGVVYSHRGLFLHSLMVCLPDMMGLAEADTVMPVVPMFHANAWGMPFAATAVGAAQVFPGPRPDPAALVDLVERERVTVSAGVPTVWMGVLQLLEQSPRDLSSLRTIVCGGSAVPRSLIEAYEKKYGVTVVQGYGMTETSPLVSICRIKSYLQDRPEDERYALRARQGLYAPGLQVRVVDAAGRDVPRDGKAMGEVWIRGPWVADAYYNDPRTAEAFPGDGWYHSGDVATVDAEGYLAIVDRMKDLIKSGGEWISSVDLENALMGHPDVLEAAVIAVPDPKWQERPLACVVPRPEARQRLTAQDLRAFLAERFPRWWVPDEVVFIEEVPKTGVGKFDKKLLRERYRDRGARSGPNPPAATSA